MRMFKKYILIILCGATGMADAQQPAAAVSVTTNPYVQYNKGKLVYTPDEQGNRIPDFSKVGYAAGSKPLPNVAVVKTITPTGDNSQAIIQSAIDELAAKPLGKNGFRGAILLKKGVYKIPGTIKITASGIV